MSVEEIFASPELFNAFCAGISLGTLLVFIGLVLSLLWSYAFERFIKSRC